MTTSKTTVGAGLIAVSLFLFWVLDVSSYSAISTLREAIKEREAVVKEREDILATVQRLTKEYESRKDQVQRFSAVVPSKKGVAELVSALEAIAARSGLQLSEITTTEVNTASKDPYVSLGVSLKARGGYTSLFGFLESAEKNIRLIDINSVDAAADETQAGVLNITIRSNIYFLK